MKLLFFILAIAPVLFILELYYFTYKRLIIAPIQSLEFSDMIDEETQERVFRMLCYVYVQGELTQLPLIYSSIPLSYDNRDLHLSTKAILYKTGKSLELQPVALGNLLIPNIDYRDLNRLKQLRIRYAIGLSNFCKRNNLAFLWPLR